MRSPVVQFLLVFCAFAVPCLRATESATAVTIQSVGPAVNEKLVSAVQFRMAQLAPGVPTEVLSVAATRYAEDVKSKQLSFANSGEEEQQLTRAEPELYRFIAAALKPEQEAVREELAAKRVQAILQAREQKTVPLAEAKAAIEGLRATSQVYHRRLREGRMEEDDLWAMLKRIRNPAEAKAKTAGPKQETASDILSEFARSNQDGAAVSRLKSYVMDCELKTSGGVVQQLVIARARPDRFRLHVYESGLLTMVLAGNYSTLYRWPKGGRIAKLSQDNPETAAFLATFIEPLFEFERLSATREPDVTVDGKPAFRLTVKDREGRLSTILIDREERRLLQRETANGLTIKYSDFKYEAGINWAHRIETSDKDGRRSTLTVSRVTINPGLVSDLFELTEMPAFDIFSLDRVAGSLRQPTASR